MKEFLFSIVVPVYNVASYLNECIESIVCQNYEFFELILIDDGSTDDSGVICDEWAKRDSRVTVIHKKNGGSSEARNQGIELSKGDYIIFLDSDDYWYSDNVLNLIYSRLKINSVDVLSNNYVKVFGRKYEKPYFQQDSNMPLGISKNESFNYLVMNDLWVSCAWNKVVKRSLYEDGSLRFKKGITSEDIDWCLRLALKAETFDFINEVIVCYRQRKTSISKSVTLEKMKVLLNNIDVCVLLLENISDREKKQLLKSYIGYQFGTMIYSVATIDNKEERKILITSLKERQYLLNWSTNHKINLIRKAHSIGGMKFTITLLRICSKLRKS